MRNIEEIGECDNKLQAAVEIILFMLAFWPLALFIIIRVIIEKKEYWIKLLRREIEEHEKNNCNSLGERTPQTNKTRPGPEALRVPS